MATLAAGTLSLAVPGAALALEGDILDDYRRVGSSEDARRQPGTLNFSGLSIDPSLDWKLAGLFTPHVFVGETGGYSDNILFAPKGGEIRRDFYSVTEAGVRGDFLASDHVLTADYRFRGYLYPRETDLDAFEQRANARLDLSFEQGLVHGEGHWARLRYSDGLLVRGLVREEDYGGSGFAQVDVGRLTFGAGGGFDRVDYLGEDALEPFDHKVAQGTGQVGFKIYETVKLVVLYNYEAFRFDHRFLNDYDVHSVRGGTVGSIGTTLSFSAKLGADFQVVHKTGTVDDDSQYRSFAAEAALVWRPLPYTTFQISYRRDLFWATQANFQAVDRIDLSASQSFLDETVAAVASFTYEHSAPSRGSTIDRVRPSFRVTWRVKRWFHVMGAYMYSQAISGDRSKEYDEHRVELTAGVGF